VNGKKMPVDRMPHVAGNVLLYEDGGVLRARVLGLEEAAREDEPLRLSHFMTCTNPKAMTKKGKRGKR
jgi:hypothetical protein